MAKPKLELTEVNGYPQADGSSLRVFAYVPPGTVAPNVDERATTKDWVAFGKDNQFLERMRALADNSVALDMCINANALYLGGRKVNITKLVNGEVKPHEEAMAMYMHWTRNQGEVQFRTNTMLDVAFANARYWQYIYDGAGRIDEIRHVDCTAVRSGKPIPGSKYDNRVDSYFVSPNWKRYTMPGFQPVQYPRFDFDTKAQSKGTGQIEAKFRYKQGRRFYGEPFWLGAIADAHVDSQVAPYNRRQIDGGFSANVVIKYSGNLTPQQQAQLAQDLELYFTSARGNGVMVVTGSKNDTYEIIPIQPNTHAGQLDKIRAAAKLEIVNANQIPAIMANIDVTTGATGNQPSIRQQVQRYERSFAEPLQDYFFEAPLLKAFELNGITDIEEIEIDPIAPFDEAADEEQQRMAYLRSITVNQHRRNIGLEPLTTTDGKPDEKGDMLLIEMGPSTANQASQTTNPQA